MNELAEKIAGFAKVRLCVDATGSCGPSDCILAEKDRFRIVGALRKGHDDRIGKTKMADDVSRTMTAKPDYKKFAMWCLEEGPFQGCDLDGGDIQQAALDCGIIKQVPYDPRVHGESDYDLEPGDAWFMPVEESE